MNLGGTPNMNLSGAARFLKQSNVGINSVQNQQVPPPMMFVHQAVAMQQFQFQQALLMQQVMATQQAAARAATVKSAQEMAAARAAEISKLLKGIESNVEEKKKSPRRFISQTSSRSRSRSISRSKSRSPFQYCRDRSTSSSPIRNRRDSRPSPISREYFGYRGRSRRGYFRGRREYGWNSSYRRDWEREKDYYSLHSHRSRSRSRSPITHRSCTPSCSPRYQHERSSTPLRFCHKEQRLERSSLHLRFVETKPIPSCSKSQSHSYSRSCSESSHHEQGSQSPIQMVRDKKIGASYGQAKKSSLVLGDGKSILMKNLDTNGIKERIYSSPTIINDNEGIVEHWNFKSKNKTKQSITRARSLSISLSPPKKKEKGKLERESKSNDWKKAMVRSVIFQRIDEVAAIDEPLQHKMAPFVNVEDGEGNLNALVEQQIDIEGDVKSKEGEFEVLNQQCSKKELNKIKPPFDENDTNIKEFDERQDDIKINELEKVRYKEYKQEMDKKKDEGKNLDTPIIVHEDVKNHVTLLEHLDMEVRELRVDSSISFGDQRNAIAISMSKRSTPKNDVIFAKPSSSNETHINGLCFKEEILRIVSNGKREGSVEIDEEIENLTNDKNTKFDDVIDRERDLNLIFEGPMLPPDLDIEISEDLRENNYATKLCCENIDEKTRLKELSVVLREEVVIFKKKDKSRSNEVKDVHGLRRNKDKPMLKDDNQLYEKCKLKENSELRERSRNKKYNEKIEYEKRKEKHHKHKKRHRKNEEIEMEENDNDENKDADFSKNKEECHRHCNKKHRRGQNHKKDKHQKKRHRHKHKGKLILESLNKESLIVEVEGKDIE